MATLLHRAVQKMKEILIAGKTHAKYTDENKHSLNVWEIIKYIQQSVEAKEFSGWKWNKN